MTSNIKKSLYNLFFGIGSQILLAAVGIIIPRLFLTNFGSEINGFLNSVNQIFSYVVLLEAGVGTAALQALYKPVAENDCDKMNSILSATAHFYRRTGWCYLGCVLLLAIVYPIAIDSAIPVWQQVAIILIVGGSGTFGYFFHAKFRMLLQADGKSYIFTNAHTIVQLSTNIIKITMIVLGMNIVFVQLGHMILMLCLAGYIVFYTRRKYPWIDLKVAPDKKAVSQKNFVLVHEISQMIFNHTDVLLLTVFTDLKVVSVYVIYNTIVDIISTLIGNIHNGFSFRLGQIYNTDKTRYKRAYNIYETGYMTLSMILYCVTYIFLLPFMRLYTQGVDDINYLDRLLPLLFVAIKLLVSGRALAGATISYAGKFRDTKNRAVAEMIINLSVSCLCLYFFGVYKESFGSGKELFGIYAVLIGTIVALLYRANDMIVFTQRRILEQSPLRTYFKWIINLIIFAALVLISEFVIPVNADSYFMLIRYAAWYTCGASLFFAAVNTLIFRNDVCAIFRYVVKRFFKNR